MILQALQPFFVFQLSKTGYYDQHYDCEGIFKGSSVFGIFQRQHPFHFFINAINEQTDHLHHLLFHSENNRRIQLFFQEFFCECFDPSINSRDILYHLFYVIMAELINVYENDLTTEQDSVTHTPVASIIRYIESNYKTCTQKSVADFFHISPNYVSLLLKRHIGMNYIQLVQEKRLSVAANLLQNTSLPISMIANESGYENVTFFYKKFHQKYGCSPKEFQDFKK